MGKKAQTVWLPGVVFAGGATASVAVQAAAVNACPSGLPPVGGTPSN